MKVTRRPRQIDSKSYAFDWNVERSYGCHVMGVVESMAQRLGLEDAPSADMPKEALEWYRFGGFIHEYVMAHHMVEVECARNPMLLFRPGEFMWCYECDDVVYPSVGPFGEKHGEDHCATRSHHGIFGTPDAMRTSTYSLKEWKCTWKTSRRGGGDNDQVGHVDYDPLVSDPTREHVKMGIWRWPVQTMCYAFAMETKVAELDAMWINGNYAPPRPNGDTFIFTFTQEELDGNWSSLVSYARKEGHLQV